MSLGHFPGLQRLCTAFFLMSNFTSKLMDMDTSLALLLPSLDQDCFQLTKEHCFHSETTKNCPKSLKAKSHNPFCLLSPRSRVSQCIFVLGSVFFYLRLGYGYMCLELEK